MKVWMEILAGQHDDDLDKIVSAIVQRRKDLNPIKHAFELSKGDRVRIRDNARPKYIIGMTGVVTGHEGSRVLVKFDRPVGRFGVGTTKCPPELLEPHDA